MRAAFRRAMGSVMELALGLGHLVPKIRGADGNRKRTRAKKPQGPIAGRRTLY